MDNEIRKLFENISGKLENTPGTIDVIFTFGTSILSEKSTEWINNGVSNMSEIYISLKDIIDMIKNYKNNDASQEAFFDDLFATIQDLSYHSAIFGIYFSAIENAFQNEIIKENISEVHQASKETEEEAQFLQNILSKVETAKSAFEKVFSDDSSAYFCKLLCLYNLQRSLLALQIIACEQKKNWWFKKESRFLNT